jgi:hypothetical protein
MATVAQQSDIAGLCLWSSDEACNDYECYLVYGRGGLPAPSVYTVTATATAITGTSTQVPGWRNIYTLVGCVDNSVSTSVIPVIGCLQDLTVEFCLQFSANEG